MNRLRNLTKLEWFAVFLITLIVGSFFVGKVNATVKTTWATEYPPYRLTEPEKAYWDAILAQFPQLADFRATNDVVITATGKGISIATNTQSTARMGTLTLASGTGYIQNATITTKTYAFLNRSTLAGQAGILNSRISATNLFVYSTTNTVAGLTVTNAQDTSTLQYLLIESYP